MVIQVNHKKVKAKAIEWSDTTRMNPICFILKCPYCQVSQWVNKKNLYIGADNSKNNHQCRHCNQGTKRKLMWTDRPKPEDVFKPKTPGWRSLNGRSQFNKYNTDSHI